MAQKSDTGPKEGGKAPDFSLPADHNDSLTLKDCRGKIVVLYFYPKDDTSGCTKEAIEFTQSIADFKKAGAIVIGASRDSIAKHLKFKKKHNLDVTLISDEDGKVCENYGVWVEKSMYGRKYMGIERSTFLIDKHGIICKIWRKVKVAGHIDEVIKALAALS